MTLSLWSKHMRELPNHKYEPTSLIWFRAKRVLEADKTADQPPAKKKGHSPL